MGKMVSLGNLLENALGGNFKLTGGTGSAPADIQISGVGYDSRKISRDEIFCCLSGKNENGHGFVEEALTKGASCIMVEKELNIPAPYSDVLQIRVSDTRYSMAKVAAEFWGNPADKLITVGITGTNGKTTVAHLLAGIVECSASVIGTLEGNLTTPAAPELQAQLADILAKGRELVAVEVSSHALEQQRTAGIKFELGIFLNLGRDHLDYHSNMQNYFDAKARLFALDYSEKALINRDLKWGRRLLKKRKDAESFSSESIEILSLNMEGSQFVWEGEKCFLPMPGRINAINAAIALWAAKILGFDVKKCIEKLKKFPSIPGRFEIVLRPHKAHPYWVIVDYAHTPEALDEILKSVRELAGSARILLVFGCGGERDTSKRPKMGEIAEQGADQIFLTSDNSRSESSEDIISQILGGIKSRQKASVELDRADAIQQALKSAQPEDIVLIAGKGHEKVQATEHGNKYFDDHAIACELAGENL